MYGLVMIVRDSAGTIERTLAAARPHIGAWTIVDTGSVDGTQELVRSSLEGIPGCLHEREWVDFGHNRSEAFALARGTADWLLALDADMELELDPGFIPDAYFECYLLEMGTPALSWRLPLLLRGDLPWQSVGAVHEYTTLPERLYRSSPTDRIRVRHPGAAASPEKLRWHAGMLERSFADDPQDPRTVFYLARTYHQLGDDRAADLFRRRIDMGGWDEETFCAAYELAGMAPDWPLRAEALMAAWELRPSRLEPLYDLVAGLNDRGLWNAAYRLSDIPLEETGDRLFVARGVWTWGLRYERIRACRGTGHTDQARLLTDLLLARPDLPDHIQAALRAQS